MSFSLFAAEENFICLEGNKVYSSARNDNGEYIRSEGHIIYTESKQNGDYLYVYSKDSTTTFDMPFSFLMKYENKEYLHLLNPNTPSQIKISLLPLCETYEVFFNGVMYGQI